MPLSSEQNPEQGVNWPAVVRTLLAQVLVLLMLSGAVAFYLRWSSDANWEEFLAATQSSVPDPGQPPHASRPVQTVKRGPFCDRRS